MTLNPGFNALFEAMAPLATIDTSAIPADQLRALLDTPLASTNVIEMARVEAVSIALDGRTLEARLYIPVGATELPHLIVYFHGGGWVIGTLDTHDATCRALARASKAAILSVAYRLAPEHRYPVAAEDCYDATVWAAAHASALGVDGTRLAVAGDSSGGNLAAAVAIMVRDRGGPEICHQLLIYPVTDADFSRASYVENGGGNYFLSTAQMKRFWSDYLGDMSASAAQYATILHTPSLANLPPATVLTAEYDPLKDEGQAYAARLAQAGVMVEAHEVSGMIHGFFAMFEMVPEVMDWVERAGRTLAKSFTA